MMRKLVFILFLILAFLPMQGFSALTDYTFYFINGMDNEPNQAKTSRDSLRALVLPDVPDDSVKNLYHRNIGSYSTMIERVRQMAIAENSRETFKRYWSCLDALSPEKCSSTNPQAADMRQMILDTLGAYSETAYVQNPQLQAMVAAVTGNYNNGRKSLLVAHSQGNFYANQIVNFLQTAAPNVAACTNIVGVASPASYVAKNGPYKTRYDDIAITAAGLHFPNVLRPNYAGPVTADWAGHKFIESYITPSGLRSAIRADIVAQTTTSANSTCLLDCRQLNLTKVNNYAGDTPVQHKLGNGPRRTINMRVTHNFLNEYGDPSRSYGVVGVSILRPTGLFSIFWQVEGWPGTYRYSFEFDSAALGTDEVWVELYTASNALYYDPKPNFTSTICMDCGNAATACP